MEEYTKARIYESMPIEKLGLGTRTYNGLKREGIRTVGEIMGKTVAELLDIRNFGLTSLAELTDRMGNLGGELRLVERVERLEEQMKEQQEATKLLDERWWTMR